MSPTHLNGLRVWLSPLLADAGIPHAFTTRHGGVSSGPWATLNLGLATGDDPAAVRANRERVCAALDLSFDQLRFLKQVHGADVLDAAEVPSIAEPDRALVPGDALVTDRPGLLIGVRTADCLPVLLAARSGRAVAAVHAGWRGLAGGILAAAVAELTGRTGLAPQDLVAAIGPGISAERYEVGPEVAAHFPPQCRRGGEGDRWHLDLTASAVRLLAEVGVRDVDASAPGTFDGAEFFSYRRDGGTTGRQAGVIAVR